jgi:hypothetical protein
MMRNAQFFYFQLKFGNNHVPSACYREQMMNICQGIFASWVTQQFSIVNSYLMAASSIELAQQVSCIVG